MSHYGEGPGGEQTLHKGNRESCPGPDCGPNPINELDRIVREFLVNGCTPEDLDQAVRNALGIGEGEGWSVTHVPTPVQVYGCPSQHKTPITVTSVKFSASRMVYVGGVHAHQPSQVIGWDLSCGCFISARRFTMLHLPGRLPRFVRDE